MSAPTTTLIFPERGAGGVLAVRTEDGSPVASVRMGKGASFEVTAADGAVVCAGRRRGRMSRSFDVTGPDGALLVSVHSSMIRSALDVTLGDGRELKLTKKLTSLAWRVVDDQEADVLVAEPHKPDGERTNGFLVRAADASLTLGHIAGIVQGRHSLVSADANQSFYNNLLS